MDTAKLFRNGRSQAVRLPQAYRLPGGHVYIKRVGNAIVLIPAQDSWRALIESLPLFTADFMESREQPPEQQRDGLIP